MAGKNEERRDSGYKEEGWYEIQRGAVKVGNEGSCLINIFANCDFLTVSGLSRNV